MSIIHAEGITFILQEVKHDDKLKKITQDLIVIPQSYDGCFFMGRGIVMP